MAVCVIVCWLSTHTLGSQNTGLVNTQLPLLTVSASITVYIAM